MGDRGMSELKHTPGPWVANDKHCGNNPWRVEPATKDWLNDGWTIADLLGPDAEANARLIAAAPELLAALVQLMPTNLCLTNRNIPDRTVVPLEMNVTMGELRALSALIAKATGGAA